MNDREHMCMKKVAREAKESGNVSVPRAMRGYVYYALFVAHATLIYT